MYIYEQTTLNLAHIKQNILDSTKRAPGGSLQERFIYIVRDIANNHKKKDKLLGNRCLYFTILYHIILYINNNSDSNFINFILKGIYFADV